MANELKINLSSFAFRKTDAPTFNVNASGSITVAGVHGVHASQNIGTTDETLDINAVGTIGWVYFKNLDAAHFVLIGADGSSYPIKLEPGEFGAFRWNGAAVHAKADTEAINLEYVVIED